MAELQALPPGWKGAKHEQFSVAMFMHTSSRVCTWTRPYQCTSTESHEGPPAEECLLIERLVTAQAKEAVQEADVRPRIVRGASEQVDRDIQRAAPLLEVSEFTFRELSTDMKVHNMPVRYLRQFCEAIFGAPPTYETKLAEGGHWQHPPHKAQVLDPAVLTPRVLLLHKRPTKSLISLYRCISSEFTSPLPTIRLCQSPRVWQQSMRYSSCALISTKLRCGRSILTCGACSDLSSLTPTR